MQESKSIPEGPTNTADATDGCEPSRAQLVSKVSGEDASIGVLGVNPRAPQVSGLAGLFVFVGYRIGALDGFWKVRGPQARSASHRVAGEAVWAERFSALVYWMEEMSSYGVEQAGATSA